MRITVDDKDNIVINIYDLFDQLSPEAKTEFAKGIIWDHEVAKYVVNQLTTDLACETYNPTLFDLRKKIVENMDDIHAECVAGLLHELAQRKAEERRNSKWAWAMYHAWPRDNSGMPVRDIPKLDKYEHTPYVYGDVIHKLIDNYLIMFSPVKPPISSRIERQPTNE
jgi:hypothetical protein